MAVARTFGANTGVGFINQGIAALTAAFAANPIYAIVIVFAAFWIGWFLHYQVFGY